MPLSRRDPQQWRGGLLPAQLGGLLDPAIGRVQAFMDPQQWSMDWPSLEQLQANAAQKGPVSWEQMEPFMDAVTPMMKVGGLFGVVKNAALDKAAKKHFGRTFSPDETGYIMDDGYRLDLSGRHYATGYQQTPTGYRPKPGQPDYLAGSRNVDHRELGELVEEGGTEGMLKFMDEAGAVRYMNDQGITVLNNNMPSQKQIETIVKDFRKRQLPLMVDITKPNGYSAATHEFERPTVEAVLDFIKRHQE